MVVLLQLVLPLLLLAVIEGVLGDSKFYCAEKWGTCIIKNVDLDTPKDLGELSFPREADVEFSDARFIFLGVELFRLLGDTKYLTLKGGFTREIVFWSESVEVLRVINTDLVAFDVLGEPNYSLKQLAIRSALFSRWSPSMMYLKSLEVIDVAYCNFTFFDLERLGGFQNLTVLDLSYNKLEALNSAPFLKLKKLKELYLQGNQLEFIWRFPDVVPRLKYITLSGNPWLSNWVTVACNTIQLKKITLMDSVDNCEAEISSGLNGRGRNDVVKNKKPSDMSFQRGIINILVEENSSEMKAIGAEMGGLGVYFEDPIAV